MPKKRIFSDLELKESGKESVAMVRQVAAWSLILLAIVSVGCEDRSSSNPSESSIGETILSLLGLEKKAPPPPDPDARSDLRSLATALETVKAMVRRKVSCAASSADSASPNMR